MEYILALIIFIVAIIIIYKNIKAQLKGEGCKNCSKQCSFYNKCKKK